MLMHTNRLPKGAARRLFMLTLVALLLMSGGAGLGATGLAGGGLPPGVHYPPRPPPGGTTANINSGAIVGVPAPAQVSNPPSVRWGFYVTYNPNSLASLTANVDKLNYVSPWFYSVGGDGQVSNTAQPAVNA